MEIIVATITNVEEAIGSLGSKSYATSAGNRTACVWRGNIAEALLYRSIGNLPIKHSSTGTVRNNSGNNGILGDIALYPDISAIDTIVVGGIKGKEYLRINLGDVIETEYGKS